MSKIEKIGRVTTGSVEKGTGRSWDQWISLLDRAGARDWPYRELTLLLKQKYRLTAWWQQVVAMGYEIHHGRRVENRNAKGFYSLTATKSIARPQKAVWKLLSSPEGLSAWLEPFAPFPFEKGRAFEVSGGVYGEVRTVKAPERLRLSWREDRWAKASVVQLGVVARPGAKCIVVITHEGIPGAALQEKLRARWRAGLARIAELSASSGR